jgi:pimeloyl-ACP methyl ester carboxylesterase
VERYEHAGLTFDVLDGGPRDGEVVALLHGFPQTSASWEDVAAGLHRAGYRTLAPDQRGYSPGARPAGRRAYRQPELLGDVIALLDAAAVDRAHVVGHDWGGAVAWNMAMSQPHRLRTLTSLCTPHPAAFARALVTSSQLLRSWYMFAFQLPWLPEQGGPARNPDRFARQLVESGLPADKARAYTERLEEPGAFTAAVNWYRGMPFSQGAVRTRVSVPTLYIWSSGDRFLTSKAAELTAGYVDGPYRFETIDGDHWLPDNEPERVLDLVLPHLRGG